jgi:hypothetical protein
MSSFPWWMILLLQVGILINLFAILMVLLRLFD